MTTAMIFQNLTPTGDWTIGSMNYVDGDDAIGLNIKTRLLSWKNDCFFNKPAGVDWKTRLGSKNQRSLLEADIRRIILNSYGVTGITAFSTNLAARVFTASYSVTTINSKNYSGSISIGV